LTKENSPALLSHFDSLATSSPLATVIWIESRLCNELQTATLILAALLGLNARWAFFAVLIAAFLIYLFR
jgi:bacteriorhodopsin